MKKETHEESREDQSLCMLIAEKRGLFFQIKLEVQASRTPWAAACETWLKDVAGVMILCFVSQIWIRPALDNSLTEKGLGFGKMGPHANPSSGWTAAECTSTSLQFMLLWEWKYLLLLSVKKDGSAPVPVFTLIRRVYNKRVFPKNQRCFPAFLAFSLRGWRLSCGMQLHFAFGCCRFPPSRQSSWNISG